MSSNANAFVYTSSSVMIAPTRTSRSLFFSSNTVKFSATRCTSANVIYVCTFTSAVSLIFCNTSKLRIREVMTAMSLLGVSSFTFQKQVFDYRFCESTSNSM